VLLTAPPPKSRADGVAVSRRLSAAVKLDQDIIDEITDA